MRIIFICALAFGPVACHKGTYPIRTDYGNSTTPRPPDYSKQEFWAALPDKLDAADSIPMNSGLKDLQQEANADVFFVHPTIFTDKPKNEYAWNADAGDQEINEKTQATTILNQATIFNGACRVYAPYYRQAHLYAFYTPNKNDAASALELAYQDVKTAFEYYMKHFNQGRPIVIASHSQGSYHCERLVKDYFDGKELQKQLVVAYLVGRAIRPDAFSHIRPTEQSDEVGVWASWNTYARDFFPKDYERYYKKSQSTNPLLWNSKDDFAPSEMNHGGVGRHFKFIPRLADAQNHEGMLWVNKPYVSGRVFLSTKRWHIADMNFFYVNIRENVALRIEKFMAEQK